MKDNGNNDDREKTKIQIGRENKYENKERKINENRK
jgi:hypothetical protein